MLLCSCFFKKKLEDGVGDGKESDDPHGNEQGKSKKPNGNQYGTKIGDMVKGE